MRYIVMPVYVCEVCGKQYVVTDDCMKCEQSHATKAMADVPIKCGDIVFSLASKDYITVDNVVDSKTIKGRVLDPSTLHVAGGIEKICIDDIGCVFDVEDIFHFIRRNVDTAKKAMQSDGYCLGEIDVSCRMMEGDRAVIAVEFNVPSKYKRED
jgi:hypothetical protein